MATIVLDLRQQPTLREVRCECAECGVHATGWRAYSLGASCRNCGGCDMRPVHVVDPKQ